MESSAPEAQPPIPIEPSREHQSCWHRVIHYWEALQVELHGKYAVERLCCFKDYSERTSVTRAVVCMLLTPFPCLLVAIALDLIPLEPPEDGLEHSQNFWVRAVLAAWVLAYCLVEHCRQLIVQLPIAPLQILGISLTNALGSIGYTLGLAHSIGFTVPFAITVTAPCSARVSPLSEPTPGASVSRNESISASVFVSNAWKPNLSEHDKRLLLSMSDTRRQTVLKVLHVTEFLLLVEFTEVVVPTVYSTYLAIAFNLPNREFYTVFEGVSAGKLAAAITNLLVDAALEALSLVVVSVLLLWRKLRIPAVHQLAFVLETQWQQVQSELAFWMVLCLEALVRHYGADFTFQFAWLRSRPPAP